MMRVLVTRPEHDAREFEAELRKRGHEPVSQPMLSIEFEEGPMLDLQDIDLVVFTSANGVRAAARRISARSLPVLAVGPATASEAERQGFKPVTTIAGEGTSGIIEHLAAHPGLKGKRLLHISGADVAGDLLTQAGAMGFSITRRQLYRAVSATSLSPALRQHLQQETLEAATFFSPRTAKIFCELVGEAGLAARANRVTACAISRNAAKSLETLTFRKVLVAQNATASAMLDLLDSL